LARERAGAIGRKRALVPQLRACDTLARKFWRSHCGYAAAQGAATGLAGLAGFIADLPLTLSIAIREIRTIGICYGYSTTNVEETDYVLHVLRAGSSSEPRVRAESLFILKELESSLRKKGPGSANQAESCHVRYLMTIEQYAKSLGLDLIRRNVLQLVPISGAVTGASFSAMYANDIGRAAYMCYRRRFIGDVEALPKTPTKLRRPGKAKRPARVRRIVAEKHEP
jgi:hypothetical protein